MCIIYGYLSLNNMLRPTDFQQTLCMLYNTLLQTVGGSSRGVCVLLIVNQTTRRWSCILCSVTACDTNYPHYGSSQLTVPIYIASIDYGARSHILSGRSDDVLGHGNRLRHQVPCSYGFYSGLTHVGFKYSGKNCLGSCSTHSPIIIHNQKTLYIKDDFKSVYFVFVQLPVVVDRLSRP